MGRLVVFSAPVIKGWMRTVAKTISAYDKEVSDDLYGSGSRYVSKQRLQAMRDPANVLQQEAIGILGVNLIYSAFYELQTEESFLAGLAQDVVKERIEIDYMDICGPAFEGWDRRTLLAHLVSGGFAEAVLFPARGSAVPPTEALYKKALVLADVDKKNKPVPSSGSGSSTKARQKWDSEFSEPAPRFWRITFPPEDWNPTDRKLPTAPQMPQPSTSK
ncbi:MAG: hypothetical protein WCC03_18525 [Candidatus Acidiferrales bacterium]